MMCPVTESEADLAEELQYARDRIRDDIDQPEDVLATLDLLAASYRLIVASRTRAVFARGDGYVVKLPLTDEGLLANSWEARWQDPGIPLAPCHLEEMSTGVYVLVMEEVIEYADDD